MSNFFQRLEARARQVDSLLCVGLDPHPEDLPSQDGEAARVFCLRVIEATADLAAAFKPNAAFFEALGPQGTTSLQEVIRAVPGGIPVVLDAKRGDIASTARAYARAAFQTLGADAITLSPYLGRDGVTPFLADPERGVFLLCKTSNPGAGDLQDLRLGDRPPEAGSGMESTASAHHADGMRLFEHVALLARAWNEHGNLGLVVGATHPEDLARVRALAPDLWILAPGVGAQGGDLAAALRAGLRRDGLGLLIPVSRGIARAPDMRQAASGLRDAINRARQSHPATPGVPAPAKSVTKMPFDPARAAIADGLLAAGCVRFGEFTLRSGLQSPFYIDMRRLVSDPQLLARVAGGYKPLLDRLSFDRLAALPYAALPIATAISLQLGHPLVYPRKEVKDYGTHAAVEGDWRPGERAVVIDDLITTGGSKLEAIAKLTAAGLIVEDVAVLVDRRPRGEEALERAGYNLHAVFTMSQLLDYWEGVGKVPGELLKAARDFLAH